MNLISKISYGTAEAGIVATEIMAQIYLLKFYTDFVGLNPTLAGIALFIAVFWDAITDPLMGYISDKTRTKFGKRRPYILIGGILLAGCINLLFNPINVESQSIKFLLLLSSYMLLNTAMTIIAIPHLALGGELSEDRNERTELFGLKLFFGNIGMIIGMLTPAILLENSNNPKSLENIGLSRSNSALLISLIIIFTSTITFLFTKEKNNHKPLNYHVNFISLFPSLYKNKYFVILISAFVVATMGRALNSTLALYYYEYRLQLTEHEVVMKILFPFIIVLTISIGFWILISKRYGKKNPAFIGILILGLITFFIYPFFPPKNIYPPLIIAGIFGGIAAASIFLFESILADIIDYDELKTGKQREGLYFGVWKLATKISRAIGLGVSGFILSSIGVEYGNTTNLEEKGFYLSILFGPVVGTFFIAGAMIFLFLPFDEFKHARIQKLLKIKKEKKYYEST